MKRKNYASAQELLKAYLESYPATNRVKHYKEWAEKKLRTLTEDEAIRECKGLIKSTEIALEAIDKGDLDHFAQEFERVIRQSVNFQLPAIGEQFRKLHSADAGRKGKRKGEIFRCTLEAIGDLIGTHDLHPVVEYWKTAPDEPLTINHNGKSIEVELIYSDSEEAPFIIRPTEDAKNLQQRPRRQLSKTLSRIRTDKSAS